MSLCFTAECVVWLLTQHGLVA